MGHSVTIGGERLGSGKKMKAYLHNYERSTHDMSYIWRSTLAPGTLVPFLVEVALPGDTFDIELNTEIMTLPTSGPLFGTYKVELHTFQAPIRLYQPKLHMNMLGIGLDMSQIHLPQLQIEGARIDKAQTIDNQQINPSCIFSYLNIRGVGVEQGEGTAYNARRNFNGVPYLAYWEIYKNYFANKQEEIGAVIHKPLTITPPTITTCALNGAVPELNIPILPTATPPATWAGATVLTESRIFISGSNITQDTTIDNLYFWIKYITGEELAIPAAELFQNWTILSDLNQIIGEDPVADLLMAQPEWGGVYYDTSDIAANPNQEPQIKTFPLANIDQMRINLLQNTLPGPYIITHTSEAPYGLPFERDQPNNRYSAKYAQEGLALKTYNSDLFNNWISTEWIDGVDGISEITKIDTSGGSFTLDELNLSKKVYEMLNRIAISGGSYDDWLDAVYTHERSRSAESPMYLGGLIKNIVFQEVVSNAKVDTQPLGTLAGKGKMGNKHLGGKVIAKIDEPSYLIGIISITPNIDYSQGNKWDTNLKTLNDLHKPALDEIGFQDLTTDQMAWFDTTVNNATNQPNFRSAGKQPAWLNYMTNVNVVRGNFADSSQMYMVLNRRYNTGYTNNGGKYFPKITDLTTYIDPTKFNHIFADARRDAQNFWAQVAVNMEVRRKMSAKIMPNL